MTQPYQCKGHTNKGRQCRIVISEGDFCGIHDPEKNVAVGCRLSAEDKEKFYQDWFEYGVLQRHNLRQTARYTGRNINTLLNHQDDFIAWMREQRPEHHDPKIAIQQFLEQSEDRYQLLLSQLAKSDLKAHEVSRVLREAREESRVRMSLLQDVGLVAREQTSVLPDRIQILWPESPKEEDYTEKKAGGKPNKA